MNSVLRTGSGLVALITPASARSSRQYLMIARKSAMCSQLTHCWPLPIRPPRPQRVSQVSRSYAGVPGSSTTAVRSTIWRRAVAPMAAVSQALATPAI